MSDSPVVAQNNKGQNGEVDDHEEHDPHFEPVIYLPEVHIYSMEEDEEDLVKLRAKLFRYDKSEEPHQWKERGTGDIKILCHLRKNTARVLMRRDRTWKICANHYITPDMKLRPNCGSDRAWMWSVSADFADETPKPELLAVRFANAENATLFKEAFEEAQRIVLQNETSSDSEVSDDGVGSSEDEEDEPSKSEDAEDAKKEEEDSKTTQDADDVTQKLGDLKVADGNKETSN